MALGGLLEGGKVLQALGDGEGHKLETFRETLDDFEAKLAVLALAADGLDLSKVFLDEQSALAGLLSLDLGLGPVIN